MGEGQGPALQDSSLLEDADPDIPSPQASKAEYAKRWVICGKVPPIVQFTLCKNSRQLRLALPKTTAAGGHLSRISRHFMSDLYSNCFRRVL